MTEIEEKDKSVRGIYRIGGTAALLTVLVGIVESMIQFLPGGVAPLGTVLDWFSLFQENPFMGMRNMGLLNILLNLLSILTDFGLYSAHRRDKNQPYAALAVIISYVGIAVFLATNRALPMLALSRQYAAAATQGERVILEAAGKVMLAVGGSHTPGTYLAFFLAEVAGIIISLVMLWSRIFSRTNAYAGIFGFVLLLVIDFYSAFIGALSGPAIMVFMVGGLATMFWSILLARRLFQLAGLPAQNAEE